MKRFLRVFKYVFLILLAVTAFVLVTRHYYLGQSSLDGIYYEKICYGVWGLLFFAIFCTVANKTKALWKQIAVGAATSLTYTAAVFFANNLWRYLVMNNEFRWNFSVPYGIVLKWDITYTYGYGEYRYPALFLIMLTLCALKMFLSQPKIKAIYRGFADSFWHWLYLSDLKKQDLTELYLESIEEPDNSRLVDYVENMPLTEQGKDRLMSFVDNHRDCFLIYLLLTRYEQLLSSDEYVKYKKLYVEIAEGCIKRRREHYLAAKVEFPEVFERLDNKFDITEKG